MSGLTIVSVGTLSPRLASVLSQALPQCPLTHALPTKPGRILFAVSLNPWGLCDELYPLLTALRQNPQLLAGCVAGIVVDGANPLFTKSVARDIVLDANGAGCVFVGRPLVEAVGALDNFAIQAANAQTNPHQAYVMAVAQLGGRIVSFAPPQPKRPKVLVLHASSYGPSNTLDLWSIAYQNVDARCHITEIGLRNGTLSDCAGCPYTMCLHFGEEGRCFYGGIMVDDVYPALREADAILMLCPNYNDALSANLTACINRLTALYRTTDFTQKALYAMVVSGYSGGDIVTKQLISALSMNKGFWLPAHFCLCETANQAGAALAIANIRETAGAFGEKIANFGGFPVDSLT